MIYQNMLLKEVHCTFSQEERWFVCFSLDYVFLKKVLPSIFPSLFFSKANKNFLLKAALISRKVITKFQVSFISIN